MDNSSIVCVIFTTLVAYGVVKTNESKAELSTLVVENVEVLVQTEQPDVNDCISDKNFNCEALHPTDPNQDKMRKGARW